MKVPQLTASVPPKHCTCWWRHIRSCANFSIPWWHDWIVGCLCRWWWIVFVVWLTDERRSLISSWDHCQRSSPSQISDIPRASFWWKKFRLWWMKLCSSDNHCTTTTPMHCNWYTHHCSIKRLWATIANHYQSSYFAKKSLAPVLERACCIVAKHSQHQVNNTSISICWKWYGSLDLWFLT